MLVASAHILSPYLKVLFNYILDQQTFPDEWSKAIICTIHRKGAYNEPNNYRGISLLSCVSKIFTKILHDRLCTWAEEQNLRFEEQAGFRKGYCTHDNIFVLQSLVQKYVTKKRGRFYVLFIDFSKAFDSIPHDLLFYTLLQKGVHGKLFGTLKSMYSNLKSAVKVGHNVTNYFECLVGTRQGCLLSPLMFSFYMDELVSELKDTGCKGVYVSEDAPNIMNLMYADDITQNSDTVGRLQSMINVLANFCRLWGMTVNMSKTKIVVFRRGGKVRHNENWYYNNEKVEVVAFYKYLGIIFSSFLCWSHATKVLSVQASKAINMINSYAYKCNGLPIKASFKLFDSMVLPILLYGSEVWGFQWYKQIENVQLRFCKQVLGVPTNTTDNAVLGECGRFPLMLNYTTRCIKYWLKLLRMPDSRYPKACYKMLYVLSETGRTTWATSIKIILMKYGFGIVWFQQGVGDEHAFLLHLKARLKDCLSQEWLQNIHDSPKLSVYSTYKDTLEPETYLFCLNVRKFRVALARFRCSSHELAIEKGRHRYFGK
jgi:hypothetical protein